MSQPTTSTGAAETPASEDNSLDFPMPGKGVLGPLPQAELKSRVKAYAEEVFIEASRYEALQRFDAADPPEFTRKHIADADDAVRRRFMLQPPKTASKSRIFGSLALYGAAAGIGVGGNQLDETWGLVTFVACLVAGLFIIGMREIGKVGA